MKSIGNSSLFFRLLNDNFCQKNEFDFLWFAQRGFDAFTDASGIMICLYETWNLCDCWRLRFGFSHDSNYVNIDLYIDWVAKMSSGLVSRLWIYAWQVSFDKIVNDQK